MGRIGTSIENAGMKDNTVSRFTSDHGGTGTGDGGKTMAEMESPFVICGKGIKKGHAIDESMMVFDTAPTIAHFLNVKQPHVLIGRPVESVFE